MTQVLTPVRTPDLEQDQTHPPSPISEAPPISSGLSARACLLLALVLPVFALAPLFYPGYFLLHSGLVPLWNVADLRANLGNLAWLPHLATRFDPLRDTGLLPYYLAALLPLSPAGAIKGVMGGSWVLGSLGLFFWLRRWWGASGALVAATIYSYLPYHLATTYVRGAWGETLFWGLFPWAVLITTLRERELKELGELRELRGRQPGAYFHEASRLIAISICWLVLGLSQLGLAGWGLAITLLLLLVLRRFRALWPAVAASSGLLGAIAIYLSLPPHTLFRPGPVVFIDHFLYPFQLFSAFWGFGASRPGWQDGLSFQLGLAALGLAFLGIFLWQSDRTGKRTDPRLLFFLSLVFILGLLQLGFLSFGWRLPLWPGQPVSTTLTYPWQLGGFMGLGCAVLAGATFWFEKGRQLDHLPLLASVLLVILLSVYTYLSPQFIQLEGLPLDRPEAELGEAQLTLLKHEFVVTTPGYTAGLDQAEAALPLNVYSPLQAGDILRLKVTWQPLQSFTPNLKVFVHLVDAQDNVLAQFDGQPQEGSYPTSRWVPGELIEDSYPILFPAEAPPGPYRVFIGLYEEANLLRLPVPGDPAGRVIFEIQ